MQRGVSWAVYPGCKTLMAGLCHSYRKVLDWPDISDWNDAVKLYRGMGIFDCEALFLSPSRKWGFRPVFRFFVLPRNEKSIVCGKRRHVLLVSLKYAIILLTRRKKGRFSPEKIKTWEPYFRELARMYLKMTILPRGQEIDLSVSVFAWRPKWWFGEKKSRLMNRIRRMFYLWYWVTIDWNCPVCTQQKWTLLRSKKR